MLLEKIAVKKCFPSGSMANLFDSLKCQRHYVIALRIERVKQLMHLCNSLSLNQNFDYHNLFSRCESHLNLHLCIPQQYKELLDTIQQRLPRLIQ